MRRNFSPYPKSINGFSMVELLVVVAILVILAGITIAALGPIQNRAAAKATTTFINEIETALTRYELDYGWFPLSPEDGVTNQNHTTREAEGKEGSAILYKELSGDFDEDGQPDEDVATYLKGVIDNSKRSIENPSGSGYLILDPFNSPIHYLCDSRNEEDRKTFNPTFDLWSLGGTDPDDAGDEDVRKKYITNYGER